MAADSPETILIFAANPADQDRLRLDLEVREIQNGLRRSTKSFEVRQQWATRPIELRRALLDLKPAYVHFCGHGAGRSGIVLEDSLVDGEALAGLFALFSATIKCVVLNACYSSIQGQAIAKHIDFVVGMNRAIGDSAAIEFATAFYDALGAGEDIEFAFDLGCNAIYLAGIPEHLTPVLLTRSSGTPTDHTTKSPLTATSKHDWDGAPTVSQLYGREVAAELLRSWILEDSCRVVLITGLGGIGKTDLATCLGRGGNQVADTSSTLASGIHGSFDRVIWRSLLNAPHPQVLFAEILGSLSDRGPAHFSLDQQLEEIIDCFQNRRCLVILDNVEAVLQPGDRSMRYRDGYEPYGALFEQAARTAHQSCLLLTSREKPRAISDLEGVRKPVRSLALSGIGKTESQNLFSQIGSFSANNADWDEMVRLYNGNPLALELAARHVDQVYSGDLRAFLASGRWIFSDLAQLLDWHLDRLPVEELELMQWFAIEREPVTLAVLYDDLLSPISKDHIASTMQRLQRRIPLEHFGHCFTLQPVLIEHVTARLVDQIASDLVCESSLANLQPNAMGSNLESRGIQLLNRFCLTKATAAENVYQSQKLFILDPIAKRLAQSRFGREPSENLMGFLCSWQRQMKDEPGYMVGNILCLMRALKCEIQGLDFSRTRVWQANLRDVSLYETDFSFCEFRHTRFRDAFGTVFAICYSPDGSLVAVGDDKGEISILDAESGQLQVRCIGHADSVSAVAFSPDGQSVASTSFDNTIRIWHTKNGECINVLSGHNGWVYSIAFSPGGELLASAGEDGTCRLWNLDRAGGVNILATESGFVAAVAFSPDGQILAVGGSSNKVYLYRVKDLQPHAVLSGHQGRIRALAFSPSGSVLASAGEDCLIKLWRLEDSSTLATLAGHSGAVMSLSFGAPYGDVLASASTDHYVRLWSTKSGDCLGQLEVATGRVWSVTCSPAARRLATGSEDSAVRIWDLDSLKCLMTLRGYSNKTLAMSFVGETRFLAAGNEDRLVRIWDTRNGTMSRELRGHASRVWAVASSSDGALLASASDDLTIRLWAPHDGVCIHEMKGHRDWIRSLAFDHDSRLLASAGEDGRILIWDVISGHCLATIESKISRVLSVAFYQANSCIVAGGSGHNLELFSTTGDPLGELKDHANWINSVTAVDQESCASFSEDGTIKVWDLIGLRCIATFDVGQRLLCGAFSSRWLSILSGASDGMLRRWTLNTGLCEASVRAHQGSISTLAVSTDGSVVATAGDDDAIRLWSLPGLTPYPFPNLLRPPRPYEAMNITGAVGLTQAQREALLALGAIAMPSRSDSISN